MFPQIDQNLQLAATQLSGQMKQIDQQIAMNSAIAEATGVGLGSLVDADMSRISALLVSDQIKAQLSSVSIKLESQSPGALLSLLPGGRG